MKVIFVVGLWVIFLASCELNEEVDEVMIETTAVVANQTDETLDIRLNHFSFSDSQLLFVEANDLHAEKQPLKTSGPKVYQLERYDSIEATFSNGRKIRFYPDSSSLPYGKNMYDSTDWIQQNDTVIFQFTERDLENAQ